MISVSSVNPVPYLAAVGPYPGPDFYYFEVIECGRRMVLTGVLVFIKPHSPTQTAMACIFALASLLGFELLRPHIDPTDSWLYRLVSECSLLHCTTNIRYRRRGMITGGCVFVSRNIALISPPQR